MFVAIFIFFLLCGVAAGQIYEKKGRSAGTGFLGGFVLGPIGVLLASVAAPDASGLEKNAQLDRTLRKCPSCAEFVKLEANVCRFCQRDLPAT
jgi:uncharacterized membrane protein YeaQ/YmgE (transglycosylase-associated protein family)